MDAIESLDKAIQGQTRVMALPSMASIFNAEQGAFEV
jgi:hypothetical protein